MPSACSTPRSRPCVRARVYSAMWSVQTRHAAVCVCSCTVGWIDGGYQVSVEFVVSLQNTQCEYIVVLFSLHPICWWRSTPLSTSLVLVPNTNSVPSQNSRETEWLAATANTRTRIFCLPFGCSLASMVSATPVSERRTQQKGCAFWDTTTVTHAAHMECYKLKRKYSEWVLFILKILFDALIRNACECADAKWNM